MTSAFRDDDWGPLAARYRSERPRALLSLDGGGIRGLITLGVLQRLEDVLRERNDAGPEFRLCDFFDYVGGTSTGAIIAALLARGYSVREIHAFYTRFATRVFKRRLNWWAAKFDAQRLDALLADTFRNGDGSHADLTPKNLHCLFLAVTRNATTDSAWPVSSNPAARFNDYRRPDCNLRIPLWELVRASAAAPTFFTPRVIQLDPRDHRSGFTFVDGGTTAYANPAFLMFRMATSSSYNLGWRTGERNLLLVSVGTGLAPAPRQAPDRPYLGLLANAKATLRSLIHQASIDQDALCRTIGRCVHGNRLDDEVADLISRDEAGAPVPSSQDLGRAFLYARYNVNLTEERLASLRIADVSPERVATLDSVGAIADLERIAEALGREVRVEHLGPFVETLREAVLTNARARMARH